MIVEKLRACEIEYLEDIQCVIQHWTSYTGSIYFREGINKTVEVFKNKKRVTKIISDTLALGIVKKEDTDWVAQVMNPILIKLGLRKIGFIIPKSIVGQMAVDNYKNESKDALAVHYFENMQDALNWMKE